MNFEIKEAARMLQANGFSVNASAAICMWAIARNDMKPPYFFSKPVKKHSFLSGYVTEFVNSFENNWDMYGYKKIELEDRGILVDSVFTARRFKTGFIDVVTLCKLLEVSYKG